MLCFRISQCQDLETEIAGLAEVGTGTETEMAAADSGAAAGSGAGAGLEVILPLQLPVTISKFRVSARHLFLISILILGDFDTYPY